MESIRWEARLRRGAAKTGTPSDLQETMLFFREKHGK